MSNPRSRIGPYEIEATIGAGGMGEVYRARNPQLGQVVALKVLRNYVAVDPSAVARLQREANLMAELRHPNVVQLIDCALTQDPPYLAMELLGGRSLSSLPGPLPLAQVVQIARGLLSGVAFLHGRGILHRDIKPSNIQVLSDGTVKLLDFGLARHHDSTVLTVPGAVMGTAYYLAPEMATGAPGSPGSDLWAVGCVLYRLLTGKHPLEMNPANWLHQLMTVAIVPPVARRSEIPPELSMLMMRLLEKEPKRRLASADEALSSLTSSTKLPLNTVETTKRRVRSYGAIALLALTLTVPAVRTVRQRNADMTRELAQIEKLLFRSRWDEACKGAEQVLQKHPHSAPAYLLRGWARGVGQSLVTGEADFRQSLAEDPADLRALTFLQLSYFQQNRNDDAAAVAKAALERHPNSPFALAADATVLWSKGHHQKAIEQYRAAVRSGRAPPELHYTLAGYVAEQGASTEAIEHFQRTVDQVPVWLAPRMRLLALLIKQREFDKADRVCSAGLALDPASTLLTLQMIDLRLAQDRTLDALEILENALRRDPSQKDYQQRLKKLTFARWSRCSGDLSALRAGGARARIALDHLRPLTAMPIGHRRELWIGWIELGQWLENRRKNPGAREPWPTLSTLAEPFGDDTLESWSRDRELEHLLRARSADDPLTLMFLVEYALSPRHHAAGAILLGGVLADAGLTGEATRLFSAGLDGLERGKLRDMKSLRFWSSLSQALLAAPDHNLEREWPLLAASGPPESYVWAGLRATLEKTNPPQMEQMLRRGAAEPRSAAQAGMVLTVYLEAHERVNDAMETARDALALAPGSTELIETLVRLRLAVGQVERAEQLLNDAPSSPETKLLCNYVSDRNPRAANWPAPPTECGAHVFDTFVRSLLESGAPQQAEEIVYKRGTLNAGLLLDIFANGGDSARLRDSCLQLDASVINPATGALTPEAGWSLMDGYLRRFAKTDPYTATYLQILWHSRRGLVRESILGVRPYLSGLRTPPDSDELCEILSRPLWMEMLSYPVPAEVVKMARELEMAANTGEAGEYWALLRAGKFEDASRKAQWMRKARPHSNLWILATACHAVRDLSGAKLDAALSSLRVSARYFGKFWLVKRLSARVSGPTSSLFCCPPLAK